LSHLAILAHHTFLPYNQGVKDLYQFIHLRYRYPLILLRAMVVTDFKLRYQASLLGYVWTLLRPLAIFSILYVVFARFLKIGAGIPYYPVYLLFGIVVWGFFNESTTQGLASLVARADLLRKISFPRYVVVLSVGASVLIGFALNMVVIVFFMVLLSVPVRLTALWLPLLFLELVALSIAWAFILGALYVRFRDMNYIWDVIMQAAFYAVPILYPLTLVPAKYARILVLNPMAQIIQDARYVMITDQTQTISQLFGTPWARAIPVGITLVLAVISVIYFRRRSNSFAEEA
jgi:ABC-2 type transport system permease protein